MSKTTDFIERITEKLKHDRELRLDISHELQTHLDEAVEEYQASDYSDDDAIEAAIKDMGDAEELTDDLWQANKSRMKLRAWCWIVARMTLMPICLAMILAFILSGLATLGLMKGQSEDAFSQGHSSIQAWVENAVLKQMSDQQRLIVMGDMNARTLAERWKPLCDAYPDEPLYQLNYIRALCLYGSKRPQGWDDQFLKALKRGRKLDPDNGIYDVLEVSMFLPKFEYEDTHYAGLEYYERCGKNLIVRYPLRIKENCDLQMIGNVVKSLEKATDHSEISIHHVDIVAKRLSQLPDPKTMREYFFRVSLAVGTSQMTGGLRNLNLMICAGAVEQARQGNVDEALRWLDVMERCAQKMTAGSQALMEMLTMISLHQSIGLNRAYVYEIAGNSVKRDEMLASLKQQRHLVETLWMNPIRSGACNDKRQAGYFMNLLSQNLSGYTIDYTPFRMSEYVMYDRAMVLLAMILLLAMACICSVFAIGRMAMTKDASRKPVLMWIGWRGLFRLLLMCILCPLGCFSILSATPLLGRHLGLDNNRINWLVYFPLIVGMLLLLWAQGAEALRQRACSLGMSVPDRRSRWWYLWYFLTAFLPFVILWLSIDLTLLSGAWRVSNATMAAYWLCLIITFVFWWYFVIAVEIAWMQGIDKRFTAARKQMWVGLIMSGLIFSLFFYLADKSNSMAYQEHLPLMLISALLLGFLVSLLRLGKVQSKTHLFSTSMLRSMSMLLCVAAIVLGGSAGMVLGLLESHYTNQAMVISSILIDREIPYSNASILKKMFSEGQLPADQTSSDQ